MFQLACDHIGDLFWLHLNKRYSPTDSSRVVMKLQSADGLQLKKEKWNAAIFMSLFLKKSQLWRKYLHIK